MTGFNRGCRLPKLGVGLSAPQRDGEGDDGAEKGKGRQAQDRSPSQEVLDQIDEQREARGDRPTHGQASPEVDLAPATSHRFETTAE
jgi:hypothetical protein